MKGFIFLLFRNCLKGQTATIFIPLFCRNIFLILFKQNYKSIKNKCYIDYKTQKLWTFKLHWNQSRHWKKGGPVFNGLQKGLQVDDVPFILLNYCRGQVPHMTFRTTNLVMKIYWLICKMKLWSKLFAKKETFSSNWVLKVSLLK